MITTAELTNWQKRCFEDAVLRGSWSKDPKHKIGCVIVDADNAPLSNGFNGFPRGVKDDERLAYANREVKNQIIVHAEANAIAAAARNGVRLKGGTLYCTQAPCSQCAALMIQAGIVQAVFYSDTTAHWGDNMRLAKAMLEEAGMSYIEVESPIVVMDAPIQVDAATELRIIRKILREFAYTQQFSAPFESQVAFWYARKLAGDFPYSSADDPLMGTDI